MVGGAEISKDGNGAFFTEILAGSFQATVPSFAGNTAGSTEDVNVTIANLTAAHYLLVQPGSQLSACTVLHRANAGAGSAILTFGYTAGSGGEAADEVAVTCDYVAFTTG